MSIASNPSSPPLTYMNLVKSAAKYGVYITIEPVAISVTRRRGAGHFAAGEFIFRTTTGVS